MQIFSKANVHSISVKKFGYKDLISTQLKYSNAIRFGS